MEQIWEDVFTNRLGVEPIHINSRLVSAQDRKRLYWCNWEVTQPEDKNISFSLYYYSLSINHLKIF